MEIAVVSDWEDWLSDISRFDHESDKGWASDLSRFLRQLCMIFWGAPWEVWGVDRFRFYTLLSFLCFGCFLTFLKSWWLLCLLFWYRFALGSRLWSILTFVVWLQWGGISWWWWDWIWRLGFRCSGVLLFFENDLFFRSRRCSWRGRRGRQGFSP